MGVLEEKIKNFLSVDIGYGYGDGFGYGSGFGYGDGSGSDYGLKSFKSKTIYIIDHVQTIITYVSKNIAKGFIIESSFKLQPCYIAKGHNLFAHRSNI